MRPLSAKYPPHPMGAGDVSDALRHNPIWTPEQLGVYFPGLSPARAAEAWMGRRERAGLFHSADVDACLIGPPKTPLCMQRRGQQEPNFERLAYQLEKRWEQPARRLRVFWPSMEFARFFGHWTGSDNLSAPQKVSHDLLCSSVWLSYLHRFPGVALKCWTSERCLQYRSRQKGRNRSGPVPDALLRTRQGQTAVEIGGRYTAAMLRHHCQRCIAAGYSWILW